MKRIILNIMKLELKHLAPYLPYGLKCVYTPTKKIMTIDGISFVFGDYCIHMKENNDGHGFDYTKPILRPLSGLTKEINSFLGLTNIEWLEENYSTLDLHKQAKQLLEDSRWFNHVDYMLAEYLFENHFDLFGLIEKNLAIDINTLKL